ATKGKVAELKKLGKATGDSPPPPNLPDINQKIYDMIPQQFEHIKNDLALLHSTSVDASLEKSDGGYYNTTHRSPQDAESDTESFFLPENRNKSIIREPSSKKIKLDTSQTDKKLPRPSASVTWQDRKIIVQEPRSQFEEEHKLKMKLLLQKEENKRNIYNLKDEALK
uniref:Uncharacterized protein n=1 Tax=Romanomermis culicivorax TaxID=13658 RepID=A0A915HFN1_ROMCU